MKRPTGKYHTRVGVGVGVRGALGLEEVFVFDSALGLGLGVTLGLRFRTCPPGDVVPAGHGLQRRRVRGDGFMPNESVTKWHGTRLGLGLER